MSAAGIAGDEARATVSVALPIDATFRVSPRGRSLVATGPALSQRAGDRGIVCIEPGVGGGLFESFDSEAGERVVEIGRTLVWEPPHRLVLEWHNVNFAAHERTEVEVLFRATSTGTMVTVVHRGWAAIRADHPARHGQERPAFIRTMSMWWGDQVTALRLRAADRPAA